MKVHTYVVKKTACIETHFLIPERVITGYYKNSIIYFFRKHLTTLIAHICIWSAEPEYFLINVVDGNPATITL